MKWFLIAANLLALPGTATAELTVKTVGLRVIVPEKSEENPGEDLRPFRWRRGTSIALLVKSDGKAIVSIDSEKSKIDKFTDNRDTDFSEAGSGLGQSSFSFRKSDFSKDRKTALVELHSQGVPAKGAVMLEVAGELQVSVASTNEFRKSQEVALKKGETLKVDGKTFTIEKFGKPEWGDDPLEVTLKGTTDLEEVRRVVFLGPDGEEIEAEKSGWSSTEMSGKKTYGATYRLKKKVERFTLGLEVWTDLEFISVPLDLEVGAGL